MIILLILFLAVFILASIYIAEMWARNSYIQRKEMETIKFNAIREKKWWDK